MLDSLGLKQIVREPTRTTNISSTLIDYVITNRNDVIADVYDKPNISDHSVIAVNIVMNLDQNETVTTYRNFSVNNIQKIIQKLHEIDWNIDSENPNDILNFFKNIYNIIDNVCPIVTKRSKCKYLPWYDHEVRHTVQLRDKAYTYFKTTQNIEIKHFYWQNYKQHRNHVVNLLKIKKRQYYENKIDNNKNNPKKMWRTIKSLVDNKSHYFSNNNIIFNTDNSLIIATTENFKLLTNEDLNRIILSLDNKMNNNDPYSAGMIKNTITVLGPTLLTLINLSLQTGVVPNKLKINNLSLTANITVYKSIIQPHFDYCSSIVYLMDKNCKDQLQKLQNRAMRIILKCNRHTPIHILHTILMLDALQWMPISLRLKYLTMLFYI
ncbi:hypothetical protein NQ318_014786 [Aromia moschata]|uniref:Uncharacterized protein n=1 Tax=Aromia moschata TaxID=1265417 RepID=A0AAV8ZB68_9CUCU|nr:hypothetical protein NQ318_014786 [Aromia moschata]